MQNVAHAYKQTQAGTMGQGEVVLLLFDGALRFLSQAREKIIAKDYAAKGVLISRTLDIIHELDSSLNMEAGGELSQNLHNLYFLCTTRLLQANLKLDLTMLDSVESILTGLHSAFAQAMSMPEAQAACNQLGVKNAVQIGNHAPRPLHTPQMPSMAPRGAANVYGMQDAPRPPAPADSANTLNPAASAAAISAMAVPAMTAPAMTDTAAAPVPATDDSTGFQPVPIQPAGFTGRRLSAYGKMQQNT